MWDRSGGVIGALEVCVHVRALVAVIWQGRGLGDNHRFKEGPHSELTHLIEPLGKTKAGVWGQDRDTAWGGSSVSAALRMEPAPHAND